MRRGLAITFCFAAGLSAQTITDVSPRTLASMPYASLTALPNGTVVYCIDCTASSPTGPGGPGVVVKREAGAWNGGGSGGVPTTGLSAVFLNPPLGGNEERRSLEWTQGNDGKQVGCSSWGLQCFPNVDMWFLNSFHLHGMQDYTNQSKVSTNVILSRLWAPGAGQRGNLGVQTTAVGVGDVQGVNVQTTGGSTNSAGDEGTHGIRIEMNGDKTPYAVTLAAQPAQTTCASAAMTLTAAITPAMSPQAITVTGSTAGCNVGDRLILSRQTPVSGTSTEEMIELTAVASGTVTALVRQAHAAGSTINAATKVFVGSADGFGQLRWAVNNSRFYSTGTISGVTANPGTFVGTGTGWSSQTIFNGDTVTPCLISLDADTNAQSAAGMRSWFFCRSINTGTQTITLTGNYTGLTATGAYKASCGAVVMGFDAPVSGNPQTTGTNIYIDIPPSLTCFRAGDVIEQAVPVQSSIAGVQIHLGTYAKGNPFSVAGIGINNYGDNEGNSAFSITAPPFRFVDPNTPAFRYGLSVLAPVEYGLLFGGIKTSLLSSTTYPGFNNPIQWGTAGGSLGSMQMYPNSATGTFWMWPYSGNLQIIKGSNSAVGYQLLMDNVTGNPAIQIPNKDGTILLDSDVPVQTMTKTVSATANDYVYLGSWAGDNASTPRIYEVTVTAYFTAKKYIFAQGFPGVNQFQWVKVQPLTEDGPVTATDRWDLEFAGDDGAGHSHVMRVRKISGTAAGTANVSVYCYSTTRLACGFTALTLTGSATSPGISRASTVLTQANGIATINGKLALATIPAYTCDASAAGHFNYIAGAAGAKDIVQVCAKDASDVYAWRPIY